MQFLGMNRVLCLSPHPDDAEISVAGTILKCKDTKFISAVCSIGSKGDTTAHIDRFEECVNFWDDVQNVYQELLCQFITDMTEDEWITRIEDHYGEDFQGLLIPSALDSHQEHVAINRIGRALSRNRKITMLEYLSPSTLDSWHPNLFVDINDTEEDKLSRMKTIVTQKKTYLTDEYLKASHVHLQSFKKCHHPVEQFKILEQHV